ncbi:hypothetical protein D3C73_1616440 [compost metagenome]
MVTPSFDVVAEVRDTVFAPESISAEAVAGMTGFVGVTVLLPPPPPVLPPSVPVPGGGVVTYLKEV